ncbi:hypothetical protein ONZ45_g146 [Pleurotus djamor]|nr:hypothetical protein ONZ45_g146 [Pleurotus djamor]
MASKFERTPSPKLPPPSEVTSTPVGQVKPELPTRTPATHRASGYKSLSTSQLPAPQNQDIMADETKGYWIGPCPVEEFVLSFLDTTETHGKPNVPANYFAKKSIKKEGDLYKAFGKLVNGKKLAPGFKLVDTSSNPDSNSRPGSKIRPDSNLYEEDVIADGSPNQMDKNSVACEFKLGVKHDILIADERSLCDDDAPLEASAEERKRNRGQLVTYLVEMAARQHRTHIFMLFVFHPYARLIRWDRSGIIVTQRFKYAKDCSPLVDFFWRYSQLTPIQRGYDPTVKLASEVETQHAHNHLAQWAPRAGVTRDVYKIEVPSDSGPRSFLVWGALAEPASPLGRGTKGWPALEVKSGPGGPEMSTQPVFMKEQWRGKDVAKEVDTLKVLNKAGVQFVPTHVCGGDLEGDFQTTLSHKYAEANWREVSKNQDKVKKIETRIHVRLVTAEVGTPLEFFKSSREMFSAIYDAFRGHKQAYLLCGLLHRDVSGGNILILANGDGLLNDWDLAISIHAIKGARTGERTGTWPFMSMRLLEKPFKLHTVRDDLESFVWVALFYGLHYIESTEGTDPNLLQMRINRIFHQYNNDVAGTATGGGHKLQLIYGSIFPFDRQSPTRFKFTHSTPLTTFLYKSFDKLVMWHEDSARMMRTLEEDEVKDELWYADPLSLKHDHVEDLYRTALLPTTQWPEGDAASLQIPIPRSAGHRISTKRKAMAEGKPEDKPGSSKRVKKSSGPLGSVPE